MIDTKSRLSVDKVRSYYFNTFDTMLKNYSIGDPRLFSREFTPEEFITAYCNYLEFPYQNRLIMDRSLKEKEYIKKLTDTCNDFSTVLMTARIKIGIPAFFFEDNDLFKAVIASNIGRLPVNDIKMPFYSMLIGLPEKHVVPDDLYGNRPSVVQKYDAIYIAQDIFSSYIDGSTMTYLTANLLDSSDPQYSYGVFLRKDLVKHFENERVESTVDGINPRNSKCYKAFYIAIKAMLYINSISCEIIEEHRKHKGTCDKKIARWYPTINVVRLKPKYQKRYVYEENTEPSYKINKRYYVIGHFKHFKKGKLAGQIIWCPCHWRGPITAPISRKDYVV